MSRKRRGHTPIVLKCTTCGHTFLAPACASSEHKRIETEIAQGFRRPDGTFPPRKRTRNVRTEAERATMRNARHLDKMERRGLAKTFLDGPGQLPTSRFRTEAPP